jgi:hypothetical protein
MMFFLRSAWLFLSEKKQSIAAWCAFFVLILCAYISSALWNQVDIQRATLVEASYSRGNRQILADNQKILETLAQNHKIATDMAQRQTMTHAELSALVRTLSENLFYLKENRRLWSEGFEGLHKKLDDHIRGK